jgi:4-hydroxy-tetrahydrodipicolinate synthase
MSFEPKGIIPAMVTPLDDRDRINEPVLRTLVRHLLGEGVHGLFAVGSQGEFYALTAEEKQTITELVVREANGRVPVYIGTGAITTKESILLTAMAEKAGADAVSIITPCYISPSENELYEHYTAIARSTTLPVLLYSNPGRTHINMSPELVHKLSEIDNIVGIKDSSGDLSLTAQYIRNTSPRFSVLMGRDTLIYAALIYGARGAIAATANIAPRLVVDIYEAYARGDFEQAKNAQADLAPLRHAFSLGSFPAVIKDALQLMGMAVGPPRDPIRPLDSAARAELQNILRRLRLPEIGA